MINSTSTFQHVSKNSKSYALQNMYHKPVFQVSTTLVLTIFAIIFFAAFAIRPTLSTIAELIKKIDEQKVIVDKLNKKSSALATAQSEYLLVEDKLSLVTAAVPKQHSLDLLLKQIEGVAAKLSLPIESIQVDSIDMPTNPAKSKIVDGVVELPFSINIQAPYSSLREMINLITSLKRFLTVESISFSLDESDADSALIKMSLQVKAYYLPSLKDTKEGL